MKIGVVLSGGFNKGLYEIGVLNALKDFFGRKNIVCLSGASVGALNAYCFASDNMKEFEEFWKNFDRSKSSVFLPSIPQSAEFYTQIKKFSQKEISQDIKTYATLWNISDRKVEYVNLGSNPQEEIEKFLIASVALPMYKKPIKINGKNYYDGAFIDNTPVFPLIEENLDYIFCVYFNHENYFFENDDFNGKTIKLYDFPVKNFFKDSLVFDPSKYSSMISYGYIYTLKKLKNIFEYQDEETIKRAILLENSARNIKKRISADILASNLNKMTIKFNKKEKK